MSALLDALEYATGVLDKPGRAVRGGLAGRADELAAILPFSDTLGWTDPSRRVSGEDLLGGAGLRTGSETGDWLAGMGVEMALDPTNLVGAGVLPRGLKALRGAGRMSGESADEAINALKFAVGPGTEMYAKAPSDVVRRTAGLDIGPDVLPTASQVPGGTGDEWELALRGNLATENMARRPSPPAGTLDDLPLYEEFPGAPGVRSVADEAPPWVPPDYAGYEWRLGSLTDPGVPTLLTDMAQDAVPRADVHRAALGNWGEALRDLQGGPAVSDPTWKGALWTRLAELEGGLANREVMGLPDDVLTAMTAQRDEVARLLGENPALWTAERPDSTLGHLSSQLRRALSGSPELEAMRTPRQRVVYAQQVAELGGSYGPFRDPAYLRSAFDDPSGLPNLNQTTAKALADPLLGPDPALAVARAGRLSRDDAADYLVTQAAEIPLLGDNYHNVAAELGRWASDLSNMQPSALKGALRADPAAAEAYSALLEAMRAAGLTPPNPIRA